MEKILGVFDFDWTVVDENSDIVARNLLPPQVVKDRLKTVKDSRGWTAYMGEVFQLLFEEGITTVTLRESIISIPAVPDFVKLFNDLKNLGCEIIIISDANTYFIEEWLKNKGIRETVHTVYSNPAHISGDKLHIQQYHEQDWCNLSTRNLCKGHILQTHIANEEATGRIKYRRVFYVGDGHNDLCPSLKLKDKDCVFPRQGFNLIEDLQTSGKDIKAKIIPWENSNQIWTVVKNM